MRATAYNRHRLTSPALMAYARLMAEDNREELFHLRRALGRALREEVTHRQREVLCLYYNENCTMAEIGKRLGVTRSTVSRTLKRGERRLFRCLRYGGADLLRSSLGETGENLRPAIDKRTLRRR